jgi:hypothetical protein
MAVYRGRRRIGAASATLSAGALVFFAASTGTASAQTSTAAPAADCKLGKLLCKILGAGTGTPAVPPKTSAPASTKPAAKPAKPKARPAPRPKPAPAAPREESADVPPAVPPPVDGAAPIPESTQQVPALPDVSGQDPVVFPETAPGRSVRPVAATSPEEPPVPPLLVATAAGLIGSVAALNLSVAGSRRRARREH